MPRRKRPAAATPEPTGILGFTGLNPRSFRWQNVEIGYDPMGRHVHFGYRGIGRTSFHDLQLPGNGWMHSESQHGPVARILLRILIQKHASFTIDQVVEWTRIRGKKLSDEAAARYVNRLNEMLWNLYLPKTKGKRQEAIPFVRRRSGEGERVIQFRCIDPLEDARRARDEMTVVKKEFDEQESDDLSSNDGA